MKLFQSSINPASCLPLNGWNFKSGGKVAKGGNMILIIQPVCVCVHNHMYYVNDYMCINASVFFCQTIVILSV